MISTAVYISIEKLPFFDSSSFSLLLHLHLQPIHIYIRPKNRPVLFYLAKFKLLLVTLFAGVMSFFYSFLFNCLSYETSHFRLSPSLLSLSSRPNNNGYSPRTSYPHRHSTTTTTTTSSHFAPACCLSLAWRSSFLILLVLATTILTSCFLDEDEMLMMKVEAAVVCPDSSWSLSSTGNKCFKMVRFNDSFNRGRGSWMEGMNVCAEHGALLATLHQQSDDEMVKVISTAQPNEGCWMGLRKYLIKRPERGWLWIDRGVGLSEQSYVNWGDDLRFIWKILPPEEKCGKISRDGWGAIPCWGPGSRLKCAVCATLDSDAFLPIHKLSYAQSYLEGKGQDWKPPMIDEYGNVFEGMEGNTEEDVSNLSPTFIERGDGREGANAVHHHYEPVLIEEEEEVGGGEGWNSNGSDNIWDGESVDLSQPNIYWNLNPNNSSFDDLSSWNSSSSSVTNNLDDNSIDDTVSNITTNDHQPVLHEEEEGGGGGGREVWDLNNSIWDGESVDFSHPDIYWNRNPTNSSKELSSWNSSSSSVTNNFDDKNIDGTETSEKMSVSALALPFPAIEVNDNFAEVENTITTTTTTTSTTTSTSTTTTITIISNEMKEDSAYVNSNGSGNSDEEELTVLPWKWMTSAGEEGGMMGGENEEDVNFSSNLRHYGESSDGDELTINTTEIEGDEYNKDVGFLVTDDDASSSTISSNSPHRNLFFDMTPVIIAVSLSSLSLILCCVGIAGCCFYRKKKMKEHKKFEIDEVSSVYVEEGTVKNNNTGSDVDHTAMEGVTTASSGGSGGGGSREEIVERQTESSVIAEDGYFYYDRDGMDMMNSNPASSYDDEEEEDEERRSVLFLDDDEEEGENNTYSRSLCNSSMPLVSKYDSAMIVDDNNNCPISTTNIEKEVKGGGNSSHREVSLVIDISAERGISLS